MVVVAQSTILVELEILKAKLASEGINSYLKNEYVNNVVVMPINQDYFLLVSDEDFEKAWKNYYKLCNLSARDFFTNVIVEAGLNSPFEDGCMEKLVDKFEKKAFNR